MQYMQDRGAVLPIRVHTIVISVQHDEEVCLDEMRDALKEKVIKAVVPAKYLDEDTIYHLQPSGRFVIGGPQVRPYNVSSLYFFGSSVMVTCKNLASATSFLGFLKPTCESSEDIC